ncbi:MAG: HAMP domain-containing protein [Thermomicrobiales bacterium]|nr:HAMP domain-containing protein [Thermomicrobiales bacterium]
MKRRVVPIRWRLTLWYAAMLAVGFLVLGAGLFIGLRALLRDSFNEQLNEQTTLAASAVVFTPSEIRLEQATIDAFAGDERFVRLFDPDGVLIVDTSASVGGVPFSPGELAIALAGRTFTRTYTLKGTPFSVQTRPIHAGQRIAGAIQVGRSSEDIDETLRLMLLTLAIAAPVVLAASTVGGYAVAGRALAPVASITTLAATIDAHDLHTRLDLDLPDDELGRLTRTFNTMLDRIVEQVERQQRFTGDAAHELRTPIAAMRAEVDLALSRPRSVVDYREALTRLDQDLERVTSLLAALLLLARADAGRLELETSPFDLAETIAVIVAEYGATAMRRGIHMELDTESTIVEADPDLIVRLIVNLVENALAHTIEGDAITLGCREDDGAAAFWVEDTGSGIPAGQIPRLFDRFYRVDAGRSRDRGGAGLGLSICGAIVDAHGGTIGLTSTEGKGTRVGVRLPR